MRGQPFHLPPRAPADSAAVFAAAGATVAPTAGGGSRASIPWCEVSRARSAGPFVVEVDYGWYLGADTGQGGARRYLCLFGRRVMLEDRPSWAS